MNKPPVRISTQWVVPSRGARGDFTAKIPTHHSIEDVLTDQYFGNMVSNNTALTNSVIHVYCEDFRFEFDAVLTSEPKDGRAPYAILVGSGIKQLVPAADYLKAMRSASDAADASAEEPDLPENVKVEFAGPHGWRVLIDGQIATYKGEQAIRLGTKADAYRVAKELAA